MTIDLKDSRQRFLAFMVSIQSLHTLKKEQIIQVNWITSGVTVLATKTTSTAASKNVHFLLHNCSSMTLSEKRKDQRKWSYK